MLGRVLDLPQRHRPARRCPTRQYLVGQYLVGQYLAGQYLAGQYLAGQYLVRPFPLGQQAAVREPRLCLSSLPPPPQGKLPQPQSSRRACRRQVVRSLLRRDRLAPV